MTLPDKDDEPKSAYSPTDSYDEKADLRDAESEKKKSVILVQVLPGAIQAKTPDKTKSKS